MATVWISFLLTAAVLAIGAWAALRVKGEGASWLRAVGGFLAAMAVGTAGFPALLGVLDSRTWIGGYVGFVAALTVLMTAVAVRRARRMPAR